MANEPTLVPVPGGRRVAVQSYGDPAGAPVFYFHGWPSSRLQGAIGHEAARELGIHFLSIDRPGIGYSDLHEGRVLRDWPAMLGALADHFGAEKFCVFGISGGGPYALVSAWGLPERVMAAAVVSSAPPLAERADVSTLMPAYRWLLRAYRGHPEILRRIFRGVRPIAAIRPPDWLWRLVLRFVPKCDRDAICEPQMLDRAWAGYAGAWVGHPDGVFHDARIYAEPWGFDVAEIRVPVRLWHGREDRNFHWPLAQELGARIPGCQMRMIEGEGHYSLSLQRHREMLVDLMSATAAG
jgi:pimeloyl-ACP methyl ester carboxylesterase